MWRINTFEGEKIFYEADLIEQIKAICKNTCAQNDCDYGECYGCRHINEEAAIKRILMIIQENEK